MSHVFRIRHAVDGIDFDPDQMQNLSGAVGHAFNARIVAFLQNLRRD
jgi:hypothetical protein